MFFKITADLLLIVHLFFIFFVMFGGCLVLKWPRLLYLHVPAVIWGAVIELTGGSCPLTPLEQRLRLMGGQTIYSGGFIEHYLEPVIYPVGLSREMQIFFGFLVIAVNLTIYCRFFILRKKYRFLDREDC